MIPAPEQTQRPLRAALVHTTAQLGHHGCTLVCRQIGALASESNIDVVSWLPLFFAEQSFDWSRYDLVIVNGEGSLHHSRKAARRIAALGAFFADRQIPAYLINTVYQENDPRTAAGVARYRRVFVRDSLSKAEAEGAGVSATVVPDLSLSWVPPARAQKNGAGIVVSDSTCHATAAELFGLARSLGVPFFSLLTRPPVLPDFPDRNLRQRLRHHIRRGLYRLLPDGAQKAKILNQQADFNSFIRWLDKEAAFVVAGRFHAVCFCLLLEIPFLALPSNTRKIEGLCADAGLADRALGRMAELADRLPRASAAAEARFSDDELARIRSFRSHAREAALGMFRLLDDDARRGASAD